MTKKQRRAERLIKLGTALSVGEPAVTPRMVYSESEFASKFPERYKAFNKWCKQLKVLLELQEKFIKENSCSCNGNC